MEEHEGEGYIFQEIIDSVKHGNLTHLQSIASVNICLLKKAHCKVGCTALHWAAGSNQSFILEYLLAVDQGSSSSSSEAIFTNINLAVQPHYLASGRTPLHYACRNGHLTIVQTLIETYQAQVDVRDCKGVTPFQLAIWQNHLQICRYLVETGQIDASGDVNIYGCGPVHWLGIVPFHRANQNQNHYHYDQEEDHYGNIEEDGQGLLPLAEFITSLPKVNVYTKQQTGHTALHKAAWGGHLALVRYFHERFGMMDDWVDEAGNYAADLADMGNTERHSRIATYLRTECSVERWESLRILGLLHTSEDDREGKRVLLSSSWSPQDIRKAYLQKARLYHPDVTMFQRNECNQEEESQMKISTVNDQFHKIQKAFEHLTMHGGISTKQKNPAHSIPLLLEMQMKHEPPPNSKDSRLSSNLKMDDSLFKARLLAVLLEYGDKGINLSNIPKKWDQIWPEVPFQSIYDDHDTNNTPSSSTWKGKKKKCKSDQLLYMIQKRAGDVIKIIRLPLVVANKDCSSCSNTKGTSSTLLQSKRQLKKGVIMVLPRHWQRSDVLDCTSMTAATTSTTTTTTSSSSCCCTRMPIQ